MENVMLPKNEQNYSTPMTKDVYLSLYFPYIFAQRELRSIFHSKSLTIYWQYWKHVNTQWYIYSKKKDQKVFHQISTLWLSNPSSQIKLCSLAGVCHPPTALNAETFVFPINVTQTYISVRTYALQKPLKKNQLRISFLIWNKPLSTAHWNLF